MFSTRETSLGDENIGIPLGPFEVQSRLGSGGMAEVWRGVHRQQGVEVAIKVMSGKHAQNAGFRRAFQDEVRAVAGFFHPGIILVFDHGTVSNEVSAASGGALIAQSPYIAMELASGGSLRESREPMAWSDLRSALIALLDALAHAHARGVIHRDIKPANVLLSTEHDARPGLKLTDFGLAHAMDAESSVVKLSGTPRYMAPEQFQGRWRDYGPWTDLYALGILAWELAAGTTPFRDREIEQLAAAHMGRELPALAPRRQVPKGFEDWLQLLLEKEPHRRFQRAADASAALLALPDAPPDVMPAGATLAPLLTNPTIALDTLFMREADSYTLSVDDSVFGGAPVTADDALGEPRTSNAPTQPPSWARPKPPAPSIRLIGAGLALYGLRSVPLVDRTEERDILWRTLRRVRATGEPSLVVLRGSAGTGKSRLVEWIGERAHEVGAATVLRTVHSPMLGGADGIVRMLARTLHTVGLDPEKLKSRVERILSVHGLPEAWEVEGLTRLLSGDPLSSPKERYVLIQRHLRRLSVERPVLLWLDDVQWGRDAMAFVRFLFEQEAPGAILVVMTAQDEALAERVLETNLLNEVTTETRGVTLSIGPLEPEYRAELVERLLHLEASLARQIEARTGGNPLFAVQLVGDWVQRGALIPTELGFQLAEGEHDLLPDGLHEVWSNKIRHLLARWPRAALMAVEIAAALGQDVDKEEWLAACRAMRIEPPERLIDELTDQRLVIEEPHTWSFVHGMLRESLERVARERGTWALVNRACADMLSGRTGERGNTGRLGRHRMHAGQHLLAIAPLIEGARQHMDQGEQASGLALLDLASEAMGAAELSATDPRRLDANLVRAELLLGTAYSPLALEHIEHALPRMRTDPARHARATYLHARALANIGHYRDAVPIMKQACEALLKAGNHDHHRRAVRHLARYLSNLGEFERASHFLLAVQEECRNSGDAKMYGATLGDLADIERLRNNLDEAATLYKAAMRTATRHGFRGDYAHQLHGLAEVRRLSGRLDEAETLYREYIALQATRGVTGTQMAHYNLALIDLDRAEYSRARTQLERVRGAWASRGAHAFVGLTDIALLLAYAALEDWSFWPIAVTSAQRAVTESGMVDIDIARLAERAGHHAATQGHFAEAREAWEIAADQWEALTDLAQAAALRRRIASLSGA